MCFVLKKKTIIKVLSIMICTVVASCLYIFYKDDDTVQTSSANNDKIIVVLDPGHGEPDRTEP
ncbi:MAG: hypothetical protein IJN50_06925 [Clostridia bacterium]|nr:hypothetical protein [Clostridia bacterium]